MDHQLSDAWSIPNLGRPCRIHSRFNASSLESGLPACAYPINRRTRPNPAGVSSPRFSLSAICQICMVSSVSTIVHLLYFLLHSPLLIRLMATVSFRKTSRPPHQSPHQSFRYPLQRIIARRDVVRQGLGGGWDALESKDNQLQFMWLHYEDSRSSTYAAPRVAATPRQPCLRRYFAVHRGEQALLFCFNSEA